MKGDQGRKEVWVVRVSDDGAALRKSKPAHHGALVK